MHYYSVGLGVERHWKSPIFTYASQTKLSIGLVVKVPFGKQLKTGVILQEISKPSFKVKAISSKHNVTLPNETLEFMQWYQVYYAAQGGQALAQFLPYYLTKSVTDVQLPKAKKQTIPLSVRQADAKRAIQKHVKPTVLHGVTGAGKTRLYLSLIMDCVAAGKNALLLYPEISLTTQLVAEIEKYTSVVAFHSELSSAERSKLWFHVAQTTSPVVIIGPRSALFLPHHNLGVIIIDEAHESSFKQDSDIRYNGIHVAGGLSRVHKSKLLIGSATPPLSESELILNRGGKLVCLHDKAIQVSTEKAFSIIDKKDRKLFKKHPMISDSLIGAIKETLDSGNQSLIFINRRGTAKLTICNNCGWQANCLNCELPVTYHHDLHKLLCHTCGKQLAVQSTCPKCDSDVQLKSFGDKAIASDIQKLFPAATISRFDSDNEKSETLREMYHEVKSGKVDILIGTQQIVKGLDLPLLATVGIIDADLSLNFPDYSSDEITFQLLSQVSGRVGRGHNNGRIFIQTFQPNNPIIHHAKTEDWHAFRQRELKTRRKHQLPPYLFVVKIIFREKSPEKAYSTALRTKKSIQNTYKEISLDGPLPSFHFKKGDHHYVQLHLKSKSRHMLTQTLKGLDKKIIYDLDPVTLL